MSSDWNWVGSDIDARVDAWEAAIEEEPPMHRPGDDLGWYDDREVEFAREADEPNWIVCHNPQEPDQWMEIAPEDAMADVDLANPDPDLPESQRVCMEGDR